MSAKRKKNGFLEFMSTLPGLLTAVATFITAIAGLYIAFKPDAKPESPNRNATSNTSTPGTNVDGALIEIIIDGNKDETYTRRFYFQGEPLTLSGGDQKVNLEIANILNTKSSVEPESVKVRFR